MTGLLSTPKPATPEGAATQYLHRAPFFRNFHRPCSRPEHRPLSRPSGTGSRVCRAGLGLRHAHTAVERDATQRSHQVVQHPRQFSRHQGEVGFELLSLVGGLGVLVLLSARPEARRA